MEFVTSARIVCRSRPQVHALTHVCDLIASYLAPHKSWTIETAIRRDCARLSRHLLDELAENPSFHYLVKRSRARRYLSVSASVGNLTLMEHLVERFGCCCDNSAIREAVKGGQLEALQWLYDRALAGLAPGDDFKALKKRILSDDCMVLASRIGHLETLQWMNNVTKPTCGDLVLREAVDCGHLRVVEWIFPMMKIPMHNMTKWHLTKAVTRSGRLDIASFLLSKSVLLLSSDMMDDAARNGQLKLLQWMYNNGGEGCTPRAIEYAARSRYLDTGQWLHSKGLKCSPCALNYAAQYGRLAVVKILDENRSEGRITLRSDHLDVTQYLFAPRNGACPSVSIDEVASEADLEMLKWLQINCPEAECTTDAMDAAAANGRLDLVQFLHENRSEGCTAIAMDEAAENGHLEVVQYLHENRTEGCTTHAMDEAARNGHLDMVRWLHFNRTEGCTTEAIDAAANEGQLEIVKFLHTHRAEGCTTDAMDSAHDFEILRWLGENRREGFTQSALSNAVVSGNTQMLLWLFERAPTEMWTPMLAKRMTQYGRVEMLEWLLDTFTELVDARDLKFSGIREVWWV